MSEPPPAEPSPLRRGLLRLTKRTNEAPLPTSDTSPAGDQERLIVEQLETMKTLEVREVMTPRFEVVALQVPVEAEVVAQAVRESGHRCFPVVADELDDLVGVLYVKDLFRSGRASSTQPTSLEISKRIRQPHVVPESLTVLEALADLRQAHRAFAVVVDEFGGVAGVITIKDLLEPLVGDLADEFDPDEEPPVVRVDRTRWLIDGQATLDEVRTIGLEIDDGEYVTFGGYLLDRLGRVPEEKETVEIDHYTVKFEAMDRRRIVQVLLKIAEPEVVPATGVELTGDEAPAER